MSKTSANDNKISSPDENKTCKTGEKAFAGALGGLCDENAGLGDNEQVSVRALIAYTADEAGIGEDIVRAMVTTRFNVKSIEKLRARNYAEVIRYLVDLNPVTNIN